jgi:hypothetical protein
MVELVFGQLREAVKDLRKDVAKRRRISATDQVADGIEYAAGEIDSIIVQLETDLEYVTPDVYAEMHGVTPQSVRTWIRIGQLEAIGDADTGYRIRRTAQRRRKAG